MKIRILSVALGALALVVFVSAPVVGQAQKATGQAQKGVEKGKTHEGTFISAKGQSFKMEGKAGKEHEHTLAAKAKVMCDGKECKLTDLKRGQHIRVTVLATDPLIAVRVEADKSKTNK